MSIYACADIGRGYNGGAVYVSNGGAPSFSSCTFTGNIAAGTFYCHVVEIDGSVVLTIE
jgi:hypothetical protein